MKSDDLFLSFIIPAYNCEDYLEKCVNSIINQDIESYEIIIVDDGSTDGTYAIAKKINKSFPKVVKIFTKKNGGAASARNLGIEKSIGKYISFVDSDDLVFGCDLLGCIDLLKKEEVDILISNMSLLNGESIKINEFNKVDTFVRGDILRYVSKLPKFPGSCCAKFFSRDFLRKKDIKFSEGITNEDIDFMISCFLAEPVLFHSSSSWYLYRQNVRNSVTQSNSLKSCLDMFCIMDKVIEKNHNNVDLIKILSYEYSTLFLYYAKLNHKERSELKPYFKKYKFLLKKRNVREFVIYVLYLVLGLDKTSLLVKRIYCAKKGG